jgi:hypothetical protein
MMQQSQPIQHMQPLGVVYDPNIHMQPHPGQDARTSNVAMQQYPHNVPPYYAGPFSYAPYYHPQMPIMDYPGAFDRYN